MNKTAMLVILSLLTSLVICLNATADDAFIRYSESVPLSPYSKADMAIDTDLRGKVHVETGDFNQTTGITRHYDINYSFVLSPDEMEAIRSAVRESDFFGELGHETGATDTGESKLSIWLDGKHRDLTYRFRPEFVPLERIFNKLIDQAQAVGALEHNANLRAVEMSPSTFFQHDALKEPLRNFIHNQNNPEQFGLAMNVYSAYASPDEWVGVWASELKSANESRKLMLLEQMVASNSSSSIRPTEEQHKAVTPLLYESLKENYKNWSGLSNEKRELYKDVIDYIALQRYTRAIPVLIDMVRQGSELKRYRGNALPDGFLPHTIDYAIGQMGFYGIAAAKPLLKDPDPKMRAFAADVLSSTVPHTSKDIFTYDGDSQSINDIRKALTTEIPVLREMAKSDPDKQVRDSAKYAADYIEKECPAEKEN